jgi:hypothetical protein
MEKGSEISEWKTNETIETMWTRHPNESGKSWQIAIQTSLGAWCKNSCLEPFLIFFDMCCPFALSRHWFWCLRQLPRKAILSVGFGGSSSTSTPQVECHAALATPQKSDVFSSVKKSESLGYKT